MLGWMGERSGCPCCWSETSEVKGWMLRTVLGAELSGSCYEFAVELVDNGRAFPYDVVFVGRSGLEAIGAGRRRETSGGCCPVWGPDASCYGLSLIHI